MPERIYTVTEVFPDLVGKGKTIALRAYRAREGLTQRELADKVGISQPHLSEMETGKRLISKEMATRIADILGIDYRALL